MGYDSNVICFGPYKKSLNRLMDYPEDYENAPENILVSISMLHCNTTGSSEALARCLGVDIRNPATYAIKVDKVNWTALYEMSLDEWWVYDFGDDEFNEEEDLKILLENGFICMFRPDY